MPQIVDIRHDWGAAPTDSKRGPSDHAAILIDVNGNDPDGNFP
jgi:hypothetical protein